MLHPSRSLLLVYTCKHVYDKNMNNEQLESISNQLCSGLNSYKRYESFMIRIRLYVNSNICIMLYVSYNCEPLQLVISVICFSLSYKLSKGVSSM